MACSREIYGKFANTEWGALFHTQACMAATYEIYDWNSLPSHLLWCEEPQNASCMQWRTDHLPCRWSLTPAPTCTWGKTKSQLVWYDKQEHILIFLVCLAKALPRLQEFVSICQSPERTIAFVWDLIPVCPQGIDQAHIFEWLVIASFPHRSLTEKLLRRC